MTNEAMTGRYAYAENLVVYMPEGGVELPVEAPIDLVAEDWAYTGLNYWDDSEVTKAVKVGFQGSDVYIQGLCGYLPEAWIKGTMEGNTITFPGYQLYGTYGSYKFYMRGLTGDSFGDGDVIFTYDEAAGTLTTQQAIFLLGIQGESGGNYAAEKNVVIKKVVEKAGTPAKPSISNMNWGLYGDMIEFAINLVDTEGNGLVKDKVSFKLFSEDAQGIVAPIVFTKELYKKLEEDIDVVSYEFSDDYDFYAEYIYLNMDHSDWTRIGLQTIYSGGGETHESEVDWYTISWPVENITVPENVTITENAFKGNIEGGNAFEKTVNIAVVGDELYIQGIGSSDATAWVKGVKTADDTYTFAKGQDLGVSSKYSCRTFLVGYSEEVTDAILKVDAANGVYILDNIWVDNTEYTDRQYYISRYAAGSTIEINGTPTGIETVKSNVDAIANGAMFNLAGQRVAEGYKGLVIKNGKKYVVK